MKAILALLALSVVLTVLVDFNGVKKGAVQEYRQAKAMGQYRPKTSTSSGRKAPRITPDLYKRKGESAAPDTGAMKRVFAERQFRVMTRTEIGKWKLASKANEILAMACSKEHKVPCKNRYGAKYPFWLRHPDTGQTVWFYGYLSEHDHTVEEVTDPKTGKLTGPVGPHPGISLHMEKGIFIPSGQARVASND